MQYISCQKMSVLAIISTEQEDNKHFRNHIYRIDYVLKQVEEPDDWLRFGNPWEKVICCEYPVIPVYPWTLGGENLVGQFLF